MRKSFGMKFLTAMLTSAMVITCIPGTFGTQASAKAATVKFAKSSYSVNVGSKVTVKITAKNVKKVKSKTFSSTKKAVAAVSKKGVVTGKKAGTAKIKCKVKYIAKGTKKAATKTVSTKVTVKEQDVTPTPTTEPTASPSTDNTPITGPLDPSEVTLRVKWDDTSNIGEAKEVSIVGGSAEKMTVKDNGTMRKDLSSTYLIDNEMGMGINLGNTMEAPWQLTGQSTKYNITDPTQYDSAWGQPTVTQEYFDKLHSYGINTVRIPVAWSNGDKDDGTYQIDEKLLGRIEEIVNYALNNGMYVIVNDHWDNAWWGQFGACLKVPVLDEDGNEVLLPSGAVKTEKIPNEKMRAEAWKRYEAYWTQIAERFKDYSDHLIFESANEELGPGLNEAVYVESGYTITAVENDEKIAGNLTADEYYKMANEINQKFVDIMRASGGNNANRHLLIAGINTDFDKTADARFEMPTDTAENGKDKLMLSVHYYTPGDFALDDATGNYTLEDRAKLPEYFSVLQRFVDEGYPIVVGECGLCVAKQEGVVQWLNDTFTEVAKYHAIPCLWEKGQFLNRRTGTMLYKDVAEFYNLINGTSGDTSMTSTTYGASSEADAAEVVDVTGKTPVWSWTGKWYKNGSDNLVGDDKFEEGGGTTVDPSTGDTLSQFVPMSNVESTIDGDETTITFNDWGYQAFLKLDLSKYTNPAIRFTFLDGTANEDNVGSANLGVAATAEYADGLTFAFEKYHGLAIVLKDKLQLTEETPWLSITFGHAPIVTGIYVYELN